MSLRRWFRDLILGSVTEGNDLPPGSSLMDSIIGRGETRVRTLGEYDQSTYPAPLRELLSRREDVARELLTMDIADAKGRVSSIPRLRELLRKYPHPLVYETLIHACLEDNRLDEAKGVAFAARQRRQECLASEYPEIRSEVNGLRSWDPAEIDGWSRSR
jgi:hypothetical protein